MKVYLDTSVYNRPFDDQTQPRIWLETLAFSLILQMIEAGEIELIASSVVQYETRRNPFNDRVIWVNHVLTMASKLINLNSDIQQRATVLESQGIRPIDALHVASAEWSQADYLVTCDDRLIRRYRSIQEQKIMLCDPTQFIVEYQAPVQAPDAKNGKE